MLRIISAVNAARQTYFDCRWPIVWRAFMITILCTHRTVVLSHSLRGSELCTYPEIRRRGLARYWRKLLPMKPSAVIKCSTDLWAICISLISRWGVLKSFLLPMQSDFRVRGMYTCCRLIRPATKWTLNAYHTVSSALLDEATFESIRGHTHADLRVWFFPSHCMLSETFYQHCSGRHAGHL